MVEDHEPAQAATGQVRIVERIDQGEAIPEQVHEGAGDEVSRLAGG